MCLKLGIYSSVLLSWKHSEIMSVLISPVKEWLQNISSQRVRSELCCYQIIYVLLSHNRLVYSVVFGFPSFPYTRSGNNFSVVVQR